MPPAAANKPETATKTEYPHTIVLGISVKREELVDLSSSATLPPHATQWQSRHATGTTESHSASKNSTRFLATSLSSKVIFAGMAGSKSSKVSAGALGCGSSKR